MRTLHADLLAAQQSASRKPYIAAVVRNELQWSPRLEYADLYEDGTIATPGSAGVALAGDYLHHVRHDGNSNIDYYRTNKDTGPWGQWAQLVTATSARVSLAARAQHVAVVYTVGVNSVWLKESTDGGATFGAPFQVAAGLGPAPLETAVAYKNDSGDLAVAWCSNNTLAIRRRVAGVWQATSTAPITVATINDLELWYLFDWDVVLTGTAATTNRPTVWTIEHSDTSFTWSSLYAQFEAEADAQVLFESPHVIFQNGWHLTFVENDTFTGGARRVWLSTQHPTDLSFVGAPYRWRAPAPFDYPEAQGLAIAGDLDYFFLGSAKRLYRAVNDVLATDVGADVVALDVHEQPYATSGYIELDNSDGAYSDPAAPFRVGNIIDLDLGYETASGNRDSNLPDLQIARIEQRHDHERGRATTRLYVESYWEHLKRHRTRTQVSHAAGVDLYFTIISRALRRAGISLNTASASARAGAVAPAFLIQPQTTTYAAIRQLLAVLADRIRIGTLGTMSLIELGAADPVGYTFGSGHDIRALRLVDADPPVAHAEAFGTGAYGEAIDYATAQAYTGARELVRDSNSTTAAAAADTAAARLRARAADADGGELVVPPHLGLELYDVVGIVDAHVAPGQTVKRRVRAIRWRFDRERPTYEQLIDLTAV